MPRRIQIIANPAVGGHVCLRTDSACTWLRSQGCHVELILTGTCGDAEQSAAKARHTEIDLHIAAGGDGTLEVFLLKKRGRLPLLRCLWCGLPPAPDLGELVRTRQIFKGSIVELNIEGHRSQRRPQNSLFLLINALPV